MPALRERIEDVPLLARRFVEEAAKKNHRQTPRVEEAVMNKLMDYGWPGNIRELQNVVERLVVLNTKHAITIEDLPLEICGDSRAKAFKIPLGSTLREVETLLIEETLKSTKGDKKLAARLLGIHPRTIYRYFKSKLQSNPLDLGTI